MNNFLSSLGLNFVSVIVSYILFRNIISGPTRHRIYEKYLSSMSKFVIILFAFSLGITILTALVLYKTNYISYINIIATSLVSVFTGFIISLVPTRGIEEKSKN